MYKVAVVLQSGGITSKEFLLMEEATSWLINLLDTTGYKKYRILDKETGKVVDKYSE